MVGLKLNNVSILFCFSDEHLFLEGDVEAVRYAVYSSECDLTKSKLSTNYAVLAAAKKLDQLKGQGIQFVTFLTEAHSLLAVFTPGSEYVTFVVVHGRKNVNVVNKFNWKTFSCPEGGIAGHFDFIATTRRRLPSNLFTATVSCQGLYAIILGPSEHSNVTDHITEFVPAVNLLHGHTWDVEVCENIIFWYEFAGCLDIARGPFVHFGNGA